MFDKVFYVYIITNQRNGTLYTGHTDDIGERMRQHIDEVYEGFSKSHKLKSLVWFETHKTRDAAFKRERRIKAWKRAWRLELVEQDNPHWIDIIKAPIWPLPDRAVFPDLWRDCMAHRLNPRFSIVD